MPESNQPGGYLFLNSQSGIEGSDVVHFLHDRLFDITIEYHQQLLDLYKTRYQTLLNEKQLALARLQDQRILEFQKQDLKDTVAQARDELNSLNELEKVVSARWDNQIRAAEDKVERLEAERQVLLQRKERLEEQLAFLRQQEEKFMAMQSGMLGLGQELDRPDFDPSFAAGMLIRGSFSIDLQQLKAVQEEINFGLKDTEIRLQRDLENNSLAIAEARRDVVLKTDMVDTATICDNLIFSNWHKYCLSHQTSWIDGVVSIHEV